ncbi:unnamed protein product [Coregonus sp. 'balchen']|nr:unnamed protein product [Coregonus sp. 'balchen']
MLLSAVENGLCVCCAPTHSCSINEEETLVLYLNADCHSVRHQLKDLLSSACGLSDLLFSACGLSILSTIICTLSTVTCSIHIFSLDLVHLLAPHRSRSVNPECTTPQDAFLTNIMDFEDITYNGSMESPVPLYPTDCPPPYELVMGQRAASQATVFDSHGNELSGERATSTAFSGEVSMDSGSLLMSEIVDIPDDSSPSEDSCLVGVGVRDRGERRSTRGVEGGDGGEGGEYVSFRGPPPQAPRESPGRESPGGPQGQAILQRGEVQLLPSSSTATATYRSPVLRRQAMLASSCSQLELLGGATSHQRSSILEKRVRPCTPLRRGSASASAAPPTSSSSAVNQPGCQGNGVPLPLQPLYLRRRGGGSERRDSDGLLPLVRSHSEPGLSSSADTVGAAGGATSHQRSLSRETSQARHHFTTCFRLLASAALNHSLILSCQSAGLWAVRSAGSRSLIDLSSLSALVDFSCGSVGSKGVRVGSQTSTDTGPSSEACLLPHSSLVPPSALLPRKGSVKAATMGRTLPLSKGPANSPLHLPKECNRSLGDLKVTRGLVARFLQRSKRNLASATEHSGNTGQGQKRRGGAEGNGTGHLPLEQVLRNSWGASRGSHPPHPHHRGHHHSHSDSRHNRRHSNQPPVTEGIHLRSCGDLSSSSSASLWRLLTANPPHGSSGALYTESAL